MPGRKQQPPLDREVIHSALADCFDPDTNLSLVDLGIVHSFELSPDLEAPGAGIPGVPERFSLRMVLLPRQEEEVVTAQRNAVLHNRLAGLEGLSRIELVTADQPWWSASRLSQEAQRRLQPSPFAILNQAPGRLAR